MKKAAVITLHYIRNYGSVLQTYATQKKFEMMGFDTQVVDYVRPNADESVMLKDGLESKGFSGNLLKSAIYVIIKKIESIKRNRVCIDFLNRYVHFSRRYSDYDELKRDPPEADVYITGSDQTWNSEYNGGVLPAYYLGFAPEGKKRIGYSVSIGMDKIPEKEITETKHYIEKYNAISAREDSAKQIIMDLGYENVEHILDPTMVLSGDDWRPLVAPQMIKEKYIIIYRLNPNTEMEKFARYLSEKTECKIVRMSYYLTHFREQGKMIYTPTVEQFLSLVYYADYVITDSFHCTAFSLNFHKRFFVFYPGKYNTRIQNVLELTGTENRVVRELNYPIGEIDYDHVDKVLNEERAKATDFIRRNCY